jgi:uncharacterized protein
MAEVARAAPPIRTEPPWRYGVAAVLGLLVAGFALRITDPQRIDMLQNFILVFSSLLIEVIPFILLGALLSATIEVYVPVSVFDKLARVPGPLQIPVAGCAGFAFPMCECGSVPVARRLALKGLTPAAAVTFMLASPIINPIVIASTFVAYRGRDELWVIVLGRAGLGLAIAIAVGWVVSRQSASELIRRRPHAEHDHASEGEARWKAFFQHLSGDFAFMGRYLVFGVAIAAALQTFIPQTVIGSVANTPVVALVSMMALAFVMSLCSEADAFVAASFVQFGPGGQLAMLVFGPMVDVKLGFLYSMTFSPRFFKTVLVVVGTLTLVGTLYVEVLFG